MTESDDALTRLHAEMVALEACVVALLPLSRSAQKRVLAYVESFMRDEAEGKR